MTSTKFVEFHCLTEFWNATVRMSGELDVATAHFVRDAIRPLRAARPPTITLDLAEVTFIDGAGLGAIVAARNAVTQHGTTLVICGACPRIVRTFGLGGLERLLGGQRRPPGNTVVADPLGDGSATTTTAAADLAWPKR